MPCLEWSTQTLNQIIVVTENITFLFFPFASHYFIGRHLHIVTCMCLTEKSTGPVRQEGTFLNSARARVRCTYTAAKPLRNS